MFAFSKFNGFIGDWNTSTVEDMTGMFMNSNFQGKISGWDGSGCRSMSCMFMNCYFNSDLSKWNVSNVTNMNYMFYGSSFTQDISAWDISNVESLRCMLTSSYPKEKLKNWNLQGKDCFELYESKSIIFVYEHLADVLLDWFSYHTKEYPKEYVSFSIFARLNSKIYKIDISNSYFDEENWLIKLEPLSEEFIKALFDAAGKKK